MSWEGWRTILSHNSERHESSNLKWELLLLSGISHWICSDLGWLQVSKTTESKAAGPWGVGLLDLETDATSVTHVGSGPCQPKLPLLPPCFEAQPTCVFSVRTFYSWRTRPSLFIKPTLLKQDWSHEHTSLSTWEMRNKSQDGFSPLSSPHAVPTAGKPSCVIQSKVEK